MSSTLESAINLSSGTFATLTGKRGYGDLEEVRTDFLHFILKNPERYENWMEAWNDFYPAYSKIRL